MKKLADQHDEPDRKSLEKSEQLSDETLEDEVGTYGMDDEIEDANSKVGTYGMDDEVEETNSEVRIL